METFSFETALNLPRLEKTSVTAVKEFLAIPRFYYDMLNDDGKIILLKFLVNASVVGAAKTRLGDSSYSSFDLFETACLDKIPPMETPTELRRQLQSARQGHRSATNFATELQELSDRLAEATCRKDTELDKETVRHLCQSWAFDVFKSNIRDDLRFLVIAARSTSLQDALQVINESGIEFRPLKMKFPSRESEVKQYNQRQQYNQRSQYGQQFYMKNQLYQQKCQQLRKPKLYLNAKTSECKDYFIKSSKTMPTPATMIKHGSQSNLLDPTSVSPTSFDDQGLKTKSKMTVSEINSTSQSEEALDGIPFLFAIQTSPAPAKEHFAYDITQSAAPTQPVDFSRIPEIPPTKLITTLKPILPKMSKIFVLEDNETISTSLPSSENNSLKNDNQQYKHQKSTYAEVQNKLTNDVADSVPTTTKKIETTMLIEPESIKCILTEKKKSPNSLTTLTALVIAKTAKNSINCNSSLTDQNSKLLSRTQEIETQKVENKSIIMKYNIKNKKIKLHELDKINNDTLNKNTEIIKKECQKIHIKCKKNNLKSIDNIMKNNLKIFMYEFLEKALMLFSMLKQMQNRMKRKCTIILWLMSMNVTQQNVNEFYNIYEAKPKNFTKGMKYENFEYKIHRKPIFNLLDSIFNHIAKIRLAKFDFEIEFLRSKHKNQIF